MEATPAAEHVLAAHQERRRMRDIIYPAANSRLTASSAADIRRVRMPPKSAGRACTWTVRKARPYDRPILGAFVTRAADRLALTIIDDGCGPAIDNKPGVFGPSDSVGGSQPSREFHQQVRAEHAVRATA